MVITAFKYVPQSEATTFASSSVVSFLPTVVFSITLSEKLADGVSNTGA